MKNSRGKVQKTGDGKAIVEPRSGFLRQLDPTIGRAKAWEIVQQELAVAAELYDSFDDNGRAGTFAAINAVARYFNARGMPVAVLAPLSGVQSALIDADEGRANPTFTPDREGKSGHPGKSIKVQQFEGTLAVVMECCVRHVRSKSGGSKFLAEAGTLAARLVNESPIGFRVQRGKMQKLRETVDLDKDSIAWKTYSAHLESPITSTDPLGYAKQLINHDWLSVP